MGKSAALCSVFPKSSGSLRFSADLTEIRSLKPDVPGSFRFRWWVA